MTPKMPLTRYHVEGWFPDATRPRWAYLGEDLTAFYDAVDAVSAWLDDRHRFFVVTRVEFDVKTREPEMVRDDTDRIEGAVVEWCESRDRPVPAMNSREATYPPDPMGDAADRDYDREAK